MFWLERPFANTDPADNVFKISGDQLSYGIEATLSGRVAERLVVYGGLTVLDTNVTRTGNPATDHKRFVGIPGYKSSLLTEYQLPVGTGTFLSGRASAAVVEPSGFDAQPSSAGQPVSRSAVRRERARASPPRTTPISPTTAATVGTSRPEPMPVPPAALAGVAPEEADAGHDQHSCTRPQAP